jgi:hypothetical protein
VYVSAHLPHALSADGKCKHVCMYVYILARMCNMRLQRNTRCEDTFKFALINVSVLVKFALINVSVLVKFALINVSVLVKFALINVSVLVTTHDAAHRTPRR